jgi:bisphosphoglycerate-dependent phosphoglycerate mutase
MEIVQIFFIFMITTSLTLTGFVIRQRKNNRMLGELVAQNKVSGHDRYSRLNVGVKNQEYVSKCPSCAEWINLEAKVCKSCQLSEKRSYGAFRSRSKRISHG